MKILFKKSAAEEELRITVEALEKTAGVKRLISYIADFDDQYASYILQTDGEIYQIMFADMRWLEVFGDYTTVHLTDQTITFRQTLSQMEAELPINQFMRISRNTIINLAYLEKVESSFSGNMTARLKSGENMHISRRYWKNLKERILNHD
ncbi:MAG: LytTR family transcriptional regulator [Streptococcaceae bacterium]|nr:LytTR family transcriptional regulator [Streptococcaceae bacterium]